MSMGLKIRNGSYNIQEASGIKSFKEALVTSLSWILLIGQKSLDSTCITLFVARKRDNCVFIWQPQDASRWLVFAHDDSFISSISHLQHLRTPSSLHYIIYYASLIWTGEIIVHHPIITWINKKEKRMKSWWLLFLDVLFEN